MRGSRYLLTAIRHSSTTSPSIKVGILLKRNPVILKSLSEFETSYLLYRQESLQKEAKEFDSSFYHRKGSIAEKRWNEAQKEKVIQPVDQEWLQVSRAPKITANESNYQSLDRQLDQPLYLVVKSESKEWMLPHGQILENELLHQVITDNF